VRRSEIREGLFLASSSLFDAVRCWETQSASAEDPRLERVLVRYLYRMASRATPVATLAGCTPGGVGGRTHLRLGARALYRRRTRVDIPHLAGLMRSIEQDPVARAELRLTPNTSLYRVGERWRFCQVAQQAQGGAAYRLVTIAAAKSLDVLLRRAEGGATGAELAQALTQMAGIAASDSAALVSEALEAQLLVSNVGTSINGGDPLEGAAREIAPLRAPQARRIGSLVDELSRALRDIDAKGIGVSEGDYRVAVRDLPLLASPAAVSRALHVELTKPPQSVSLGPRVLRELARGVDIIHHLEDASGDEGLQRFRRGFWTRFGEGRPVPLALALDEDLGIPFGPGISPARAEDRDALLLRIADRALAAGEQSVELTSDDLLRIGAREVLPLPDAFYIKARLAATSPEAIDDRFEVYLEGGMGPSGARLLGRSCEGDALLREGVVAHLRQEEELEPDAVFAEIQYAPQDHVGNVEARPALRDFEIPYLGRGTVVPGHQIPVSDLTVLLEGDEIVLRSVRLGRRVLPRLSAARKYWFGGCPPVYRFLCALQAQGKTERFSWHWGAAEELSFLPRVTAGRLVLSRARWRASEDELRVLDCKTDAARFAAVQLWRRRRRMPRYILVLEGDREMLVDFDDILSVDAFLAATRNARDCVLEEFWPAPERLCATGEEGRYTHELIVPFVSARARTPKRTPAIPDCAVERDYPPGSEWLYLKIYTGRAEADRLLSSIVAPLVRGALESGAADRWFFVRYGDPEWHLRVRLHGSPVRLLTDVLPLFRDALAPLLQQRVVSSLQLDTYSREVERYGGGVAIELAERVFQADSEAVAEFLALAGEEVDERARWMWGLRGMHQLMADFRIDNEARLGMLAATREARGRKVGEDRGLRNQLAARFRSERAELERLLEPDTQGSHPMRTAFAILNRRSARLLRTVEELRSLQDRLRVPIEGLVGSFIHMFINRLQEYDASEHELILYDFLHRLAIARHERQRPR
jgi:thiopeptide-type bacteriocin biosynthesis protein